MGNYRTIMENDVVQFIENHKWCGCLGIVSEIKSDKIMVGVPIPEQGIAYIFCKNEDIELVGISVFEFANKEDEDEEDVLS